MAWIIGATFLGACGAFGPSRPISVLTVTPAPRRHSSKEKRHQVIQPKIRVECRTILSSLQQRDEQVEVIGSTPEQAAQEEKEEENSSKRRLSGIAVLLTVPLSWGTYGPVVKYLYALDPPLPGLVFSAAYYILAAVTLWVLEGVFHTRSTAAGVDTTASATPGFLSADELAWRGGLELGSYLFLGNLVQVLALKSVPADRAGFLVQLTTIIVPFLEAGFTGRNLPRRIWMACWIAMSGVVVIQSESLMSCGGFGLGDSMIILAAIFYSLHVVRLGDFASKTAPLRLAASKATTEAILSVALVAVLFAVAGSGFGPAVEIQSFSEGVKERGLQTDSWVPVLCAVLWTGWATCAYTIFAQSYGQSRVKPTDANLIYTVQPIFTAVFAFVLIGETISNKELIGGALIAYSVYVVASTNEELPS